MTDPSRPDTPEELVPQPAPLAAPTAHHGADTATLELDFSGQTQGKTPQTRLASRAVLSLCHAASSFNLYDAANEAVTGFITDLKTNLFAFFGGYGALDLEVRPWEFIYGGEVVFLDRDRERSLPFRLYRDGVRRLVLGQETTWEDVIQLLGILAIRAKGIRQQEDDVVTMLWNASFKTIEVEAVEGLVAEDDEREAETSKADGPVPKTTLQALAFNAPYAFDYPAPTLGDRGTIGYRPIPPQYLERIRQQDSQEVVPAECGALVAELLAQGGDAFDPLTADDLAPLLHEVRSFLLAEGKVKEYSAVLRLVAARAPEAVREAALGAFADSEVLRRLLNLSAEGVEMGAEELAATAALIPGDQVAVLLAFLAEKPPEKPRALAIELLLGQAKKQPERIAKRLLADPDNADPALLSLLASVDPSGVVQVAMDLLASKEQTVQMEALKVVAAAPYGPRIGKTLVGALKSQFEGVRRLALSTLVARKERRAFDQILETLRGLAEKKPSPAELAALGEALVTLEEEKSLALLRDWVKPGGLLGRIAAAPLPLRMAAVSGLAISDAKEADDMLVWLSTHSSGELQQHCTAALARRRGEGGKAR
jgi:hypothetical protein